MNGTCPTDHPTVGASLHHYRTRSSGEQRGTTVNTTELDEAVPESFAQVSAQTAPKCPQLPKLMTSTCARVDQAATACAFPAGKSRDTVPRASRGRRGKQHGEVWCLDQSRGLCGITAVMRRPEELPACASRPRCPGAASGSWRTPASPPPRHGRPPQPARASEGSVALQLRP